MACAYDITAYFAGDNLKTLCVGAALGGAVAYYLGGRSASGGSSAAEPEKTLAPGELGVTGSATTKGELPEGMWFSENGHIPGQPGGGGEIFAMAIDEILVDEQSKYQHVQMFKSKTYGTVLALDGCCQLTEFDEFSYQEMMVHLAMCSHPNPKNVLVVGGGDGGVLREVLKHTSVESVTLCEIDQMVMDVSAKHLPNISAGAFTHPKTTIFCGDGMAYMREHENNFDVIITDSSDPVGPAEALFEEGYYQLMKRALRSDGLLCTQAESMWFAPEVIKDMLAFSRILFPSVAYAYTTIPTYASGTIGFLLCSKDASTTFATPKQSVQASMGASGESLRYYSTPLHAASFVLPEFCRKLFEASA